MPESMQSIALAAGALFLMVVLAIASSRIGVFYWIVLPFAGYKVAEWLGVLMGLALAAFLSGCVWLYGRIRPRKAD